MRQAAVLYKGEEAGTLIQHDDGSFTFRYHDGWLTTTDKPSISLTLPKQTQTHQAKYLFPFFYNMLPEGTNRQIICKMVRIDPDDYFGLLLTTAQTDTIGAVRVTRLDA